MTDSSEEQKPDAQDQELERIARQVLTAAAIANGAADTDKVLAILGDKLSASRTEDPDKMDVRVELSAGQFCTPNDAVKWLLHNNPELVRTDRAWLAQNPEADRQRQVGAFVANKYRSLDDLEAIPESLQQEAIDRLTAEQRKSLLSARAFGYL